MINAKKVIEELFKYLSSEPSFYIDVDKETGDVTLDGSFDYKKFLSKLKNK